MDAFITVDPADGQEIERHALWTDADVRRALSATAQAQRGWRREPVERRADVLQAIAELLRTQADGHARLMTREMGKPLPQAFAEVEKCAWACEHYSEAGPAVVATEDAAAGSIACRPLGVVFAIMPWNFPYWQVLRFAAPNLLAGNAVLLKHAPNTTGAALAIEKLLREAGLPEHVFRSLVIDHERAGAVIAAPEVRAVTFTGSTRAGRLVAEQAGRALKKAVLELGGSDAYVVLEDADLDLAAEKCVTSRLQNTGQSCIAAKRFVVVEPVRERFTALVVERMAAARIGHPLEEGVDLGPLARVDLRDTLHAQVSRSVEWGARCLLGGEVPSRPGAWYPPTVLADVAPGQPAWDEELFGPVASIIGVTDEEDAIRVANGTPYGLGAAVFSRDVERATRLAREELEAGSVFVNDFVRSDPRLPFGGVKDSGFGRELGRPGLLEFVNQKTVVVG